MGISPSRGWLAEVFYTPAYGLKPLPGFFARPLLALVRLGHFFEHGSAPSVSCSKSVAKIILTLNYTKHLRQKNLIDPNLALKTCLFLCDDQAADEKVKQEAGETLYEISELPSVAYCLAQDRRLNHDKLNHDVAVHILAFSPSVAANETQQLLSKIPKTNSPDADISRQNAKQAIEQASKLANGDASRAITGAGLSGLIENQSARANALAQASRLAVSNSDLKEQTLKALYHSSRLFFDRP